MRGSGVMESRMEKEHTSGQKEVSMKEIWKMIKGMGKELNITVMDPSNIKADGKMTNTMGMERITLTQEIITKAILLMAREKEWAL